jgi:hypothetical protein
MAPAIVLLIVLIFKPLLFKIALIESHSYCKMCCGNLQSGYE